MAYQMAATEVTLNDLEGHSPVAGLFKCNSSNICAAFYTISTDSVLARFLCVSRACTSHTTRVTQNWLQLANVLGSLRVISLYYHLAVIFMSHLSLTVCLQYDDYRSTAGINCGLLSTQVGKFHSSSCSGINIISSLVYRIESLFFTGNIFQHSRIIACMSGTVMTCILL